MNMLDSLDLFSTDLVSAICFQPNNASETTAQARAQRYTSRIHARRTKSEAHLAEILPARFTPGESWHVISHGDIDSLSYLTFVLAGVTHLDHVAISTWCMARVDVEQLATWLDAGRIDQLDIYVGDIFPNQYGDEYAYLLEIAEKYGCRVVVARNHSKIMLMRNESDGYYLVSESSANVNTNPRIEQTAIHASQELYAFYLDFFAGLKTIDRKSA